MKLSLFCTFLLAAGGAFAQTQNPDQSAQDRQFVQRAAQIEMTQAHMAQLAQQRSSSQSMKAFAQSVNSDHQASFEQLGSIAGRYGLTMPKGIDQQRQSEMQPLQHVSGNSFDQQFKNIEVQQDQQELNWLRSAQSSLSNQDLKNYAALLQSSLERELNGVQNLSANGNFNGSPVTTATTPQPMTTGAARTNPSNSAYPQNGSANRDSTPENSGATQNTEYGTVTGYIPGKSLELKVRGHLGRQVYDLAAISLNNQLPNLKVGDQVVVTEMTDANGHSSIGVSRQ